MADYTAGELRALLAPLLGVDPEALGGWAIVGVLTPQTPGPQIRVRGSLPTDRGTFNMLVMGMSSLVDDQIG